MERKQRRRQQPAEAAGITLQCTESARASALGGNCCDQVFLYREWIRNLFRPWKHQPGFGQPHGRAIAMDYAQYPDETGGLVLVATAPRFSVDREGYRHGPRIPGVGPVGMANSAPQELVDRFVKESMQADRMPGIPICWPALVLQKKGLKI